MAVASGDEHDVASCAAAMVPCMRLYAFLGQTIRRAQQQQQQQGGSAPSAGAYQEWVDTYADAGFEELAATLERLLDTYAARSAAGGTEAGGTEAALRAHYVRAMELERDFFLAWSPGGTAADGGKEEL